MIIALATWSPIRWRASFAGSKNCGGEKRSGESKLVLHTIKEVIDLPPEVIEERLRVRENEGTIFDGWGYPMGDAGSWFTLYPNHDSVSLSLMCSTKALKEMGVCLRERIEDLKAHPYIAGIIKGGELREYQAHILGLAGRMKLDDTYGDGVLLAGEAGGFQTAFCVGVPCGMLSGITAAKAIESARKQGSYDRAALSCYKDLLYETGLPRTLYAAKSFHEFMLGKGFDNMGEFMGKAQIFLGEFVDDEVDFLDPERWPSTKHMYEYFLQPYLGKYKRKLMNPIMKYADSSEKKREMRKIRRTV